MTRAGRVSPTEASSGGTRPAAITANRLRTVEATFGIGANSQRASGTTKGSPRLWGEAAGNVKVSTLIDQFNQKKPGAPNENREIESENDTFFRQIKRNSNTCRSEQAFIT
jgi:hypothetical protein